MNELHRILDAWRRLDPQEDAVLATVVHVSGSAYRRPGARMLVLPRGERVGTVSGGCLEGEITRKAWWFTESPDPVVRVYDTTSDDDAVWEFGLGCNGVVHVLLERVHARRTAEALEFLDMHRCTRDTVVVATVIAVSDETTDEGGAHVGDRLLVEETGTWGGSLAGSTFADDLLPHAHDALLLGRSCLAKVGGCDVFIEVVAPAQDLVVFGAGEDAVPLVTLAAQLGWRVTVADGRPAYARAARFPGAARVALLRGDDPLDDIAVERDTAVVLMTHNYPLDRRLLPALLERHPRYLGLLGPRQRAERLFRDLDQPMPASLHAPIGLDLGADTPASIALAIASELQAVLAGREGGMLRRREQTIHGAVPEVGSGLGGATGTPRSERPAYCETTAGPP